VGMSTHPFHPMGLGQHGELDLYGDKAPGKHLGKRIRFDELPEDCRRLVLGDYVQMWVDSKSTGLWLEPAQVQE